MAVYGGNACSLEAHGAAVIDMAANYTEKDFEALLWLVADVGGMGAAVSERDGRAVLLITFESKSVAGMSCAPPGTRYLRGWCRDLDKAVEEARVASLENLEYP